VSEGMAFSEELRLCKEGNIASAENVFKRAIEIDHRHAAARQSHVELTSTSKTNIRWRVHTV